MKSPALLIVTGAERGRQHGQHIDDWFRAEQELRSKAS